MHMSNTLKKIIGSVLLLALGALLFYGFLIVKTWHYKAVYLDCVINAKGDQTLINACSK